MESYNQPQSSTSTSQPESDVCELDNKTVEVFKVAHYPTNGMSLFQTREYQHDRPAGEESQPMKQRRTKKKSRNGVARSRAADRHAMSSTRDGYSTSTPASAPKDGEAATKTRAGRVPPPIVVPDHYSTLDGSQYPGAHHYFPMSAPAFFPAYEPGDPASTPYVADSRLPTPMHTPSLVIDDPNTSATLPSVQLPPLATPSNHNAPLENLSSSVALAIQNAMLGYTPLNSAVTDYISAHSAHPITPLVELSELQDTTKFLGANAFLTTSPDTVYPPSSSAVEGALPVNSAQDDPAYGLGLTLTSEPIGDVDDFPVLLQVGVCIPAPTPADPTTRKGKRRRRSSSVPPSFGQDTGPATSYSNSNEAAGIQALQGPPTDIRRGVTRLIPDCGPQAFSDPPASAPAQFGSVPWSWGGYGSELGNVSLNGPYDRPHPWAVSSFHPGGPFQTGSMAPRPLPTSPPGMPVPEGPFVDPGTGIVVDGLRSEDIRAQEVWPLGFTVPNRDATSSAPPAFPVPVVNEPSPMMSGIDNVAPLLALPGPSSPEHPTITVEPRVANIVPPAVNIIPPTPLMGITAHPTTSLEAPAPTFSSLAGALDLPPPVHSASISTQQPISHVTALDNAIQGIEFAAPDQEVFDEMDWMSTEEYRRTEEDTHRLPALTNPESAVFASDFVFSFELDNLMNSFVG